MQNAVLCGLNATSRTLFRPVQAHAHELKHLGCGFACDGAAVFRLQRGNAVNERADCAGSEGLMLDHWQMPAIAQKDRLHLRKQLGHAQLMGRRNDGVIGPDNVQNRYTD